MNDNELNIFKPKPLIYISNDLTQRERLIFNFLIKLVNTQNKEENLKYVFTLANIKDVFNIRHFEAIRDILTKLSKTIFMIDILNEEKELKPIKSMSIKNKNIEIIFTSEFLELFNQNKYATVDLYTLTKLKSKYSIIIYEMIMDFYRINNHFLQIPHLPIETFKKLVGFKNISNYDLKRIVLNKVIEDINQHTDFNLEYQFLNKNGSKKTTHIEFKFSKDKSIKLQKNQEIKEVKKEKIGIELLNEIKKQRELLKNEMAQIGQRREELTKLIIEKEEIIKRYKKVMLDFDNKVYEWEFNDLNKKNI